jgi:type IV secretory pathway VirB2 component (pilin)
VTVWSEIFLGIIAFAMLAIAIVQIGVLVAAGRLARRAGRLLDHVEVELKPVFGNLNAIGRDASRAAALATAQVERVDRLFTDVTQRVDETVQSVHSLLAGPSHEGRAILGALAVAIRTLRGARARRPRSEDEDALFI